MTGGSCTGVVVVVRDLVKGVGLVVVVLLALVASVELSCLRGIDL